MTDLDYIRERAGRYTNEPNSCIWFAEQLIVLCDRLAESEAGEKKLREALEEIASPPVKREPARLVSWMQNRALRALALDALASAETEETQ